MEENSELFQQYAVQNIFEFQIGNEFNEEEVKDLIDKDYMEKLKKQAGTQNSQNCDLICIKTVIFNLINHVYANLLFIPHYSLVKAHAKNFRKNHY